MTLPQWSREEFDPERIKITDDVLQERAARITPLILKDGELHYFTIPDDLRNVAFTWEPQNLVMLDERFDFEEGRPVTKDWFVEVGRSTTHHSCGYYGFFKPSIAEVLAQLPDDPEITAFYLDVDSIRILDEGKGHIANVYWLTNKPRSEAWQRARIERLLKPNA